MDKITINELKGYLGTGLKCKNGNSILELSASYLLIDDNFKEEFISICEITNGGKYWIKPLLYPLSSLTEYREDLGFVPMKKLKELYFKTNIIKSGGTSLEEELVIKDGEFKNHFQDYYYTSDNVYTSYNPIGYNESVNIYNQLYEWHIDVHNLIDRNLAINIKTLKQ
jgi:hypothetical protein